VATRKLVASIEQKIILERLAELSEKAQGRTVRKPVQPWDWTP